MAPAADADPVVDVAPAVVGVAPAVVLVEDVDLAAAAPAVFAVAVLAAKPVDPETCRNTSGNYVNLKK